MLGPTLGIMVRDWGLCWAGAGHQICGLGPLPGLIFCAGAFAGPHFVGVLGPMLGRMFVL